MAFVSTESLIDYTFCKIIQHLNKNCTKCTWDRETKKRVPKDTIKEALTDNEFNQGINVFYVKPNKDCIYIKYNSDTSIEIQLNWVLDGHQYLLGSYKIKPRFLSKRDCFDDGSTSYFYGKYNHDKHNYCEFLNELKMDISNAINMDTNLWYRKEIPSPVAFK